MKSLFTLHANKYQDCNIKEPSRRVTKKKKVLSGFSTEDNNAYYSGNTQTRLNKRECLKSGCGQ